ncbi:MAG: ankyrin repeat domain-containing protein [Elusimicrobiota bacterium]
MKNTFLCVPIIGMLVALAGCGTGLTRAAKHGDVTTLQKLLDQGADINKSAMGSGTMAAGTPLFYAAYNCRADAARYLVNKGADVEVAGYFRGGFFVGRPLHAAVEKDCVEVAQILLDAGADINAKTKTNDSALASAARRGNIKILKYLIARGADVDDATSVLRKDGATGILRKDGHSDGLALLEKYGSPIVSAEKRPKEPAAPLIISDVDALPPMFVKHARNAYAIVIGIENYRQKLPTADFAVKDARTVTDYLTKVLGYPEENVITLLNDRASNVDLAKYFEKWLPNNVERDSAVFVYYSGHGAPNLKTGDAYLVPYDGDPSFIEQTGYSLKRMYQALGKLPAKEIVVALDACFSGAGGRSVVAEGARPLVMELQTSFVLTKNIQVMTAAAGDQISSTYKDEGHGLFTYFMLKGIKNENVLNPDGSIKMNDLFGYLRPQVERIARKQYNNEQTPQLIGATKD